MPENWAMIGVGEIAAAAVQNQRSRPAGSARADHSQKIPIVPPVVRRVGRRRPKIVQPKDP